MDVCRTGLISSRMKMHVPRMGIGWDPMEGARHRGPTGTETMIGSRVSDSRLKMNDPRTKVE